MTFPYKNTNWNWDDTYEAMKQYRLETQSVSGSFSTPFFKQPFIENLFEAIDITVFISVPYTGNYGKLIIDIEYDIELISWDEYIKVDNVSLEKTRTKFRKEYHVENYYHVVIVNYYRYMDEAYYRWNNKRNTGMNVSWHFEASEEEYENTEEYEYENKYEYNNQYFIKLANIIHEQNGVTDEMKAMTDTIWLGKIEEETCTVGDIYERSKDILYSKYEKVPVEPSYKNEISEETLEEATEIYFRIAFCPDIEQEVVEFYQKLFQYSPPETVLKTLVRILYVANENKWTEHYNIAKTLFDKTANTMDLHFRDLAVLTTTASDLELYQELQKHHQLQPDIESKHGDYPDVEGLINHPVHISEHSEGLAAFIPFCSIGDNLIGTKFGNLQVCDLFREKVVSGRLCYEADLNQHMKSHWYLGGSLQKGFSFLIDTSDEYDVKNIIKQVESPGKLSTISMAAYKTIENSNTLEILLNTISKQINTKRPIHSCERMMDFAIIKIAIARIFYLRTLCRNTHELTQ